MVWIPQDHHQKKTRKQMVLPDTMERRYHIVGTRRIRHTRSKTTVSNRAPASKIQKTLKTDTSDTGNTQSKQGTVKERFSIAGTQTRWNSYTVLSGHRNIKCMIYLTPVITEHQVKKTIHTAVEKVDDAIQRLISNKMQITQWTISLICIQRQAT